MTSSPSRKLKWRSWWLSETCSGGLRPSDDINATLVERRYNKSIFQEGNGRRGREFFSAVQKLKFDQKNRRDQFAANFSDERGGGCRCAAGREQIVDQNDLFAGDDRVNVQFHLRFAVLERVFRAFGLVRQSAFFPDRHKTNAEFICHRRTEEKATRIDSYNFVDLPSAALVKKQVHRRTKQRAVFQNRRDIFENDSPLREIRHVAHAPAQLIDLIGIHRPRR